MVETAHETPQEYSDIRQWLGDLRDNADKFTALQRIEDESLLVELFKLFSSAPDLQKLSPIQARELRGIAIAVANHLKLLKCDINDAGNAGLQDRLHQLIEKLESVKKETDEHIISQTRGELSR